MVKSPHQQNVTADEQGEGIFYHSSTRRTHVQ